MTATCKIQFEDDSICLEVRALSGTDPLGAPFRYELDLFSPEPGDACAILGKPCNLRLSSDYGERFLAGLVTRFVRIATAQASSERCYRATVEPPWALLRLRKQSRVYQHIDGYEYQYHG
jgi:type VI secretion system secreted protein VgrG